VAIAADERLLRALAEQLKLPLLQIARAAELAREDGRHASWDDVGLVADGALRLVDGFLLSAAHDQQALLEPVSVSSVLTDVAHQLSPLAQRHACDIEVRLSGKYGPVMASRQSLESALVLLGSSMMESQTDHQHRHQIVLAAHRSPKGIVTGIFDDQPGLSADMLRRGQALYGHARQPLPFWSSSSGAGVFVADALLRSMAAPLHTARHDRLTGLATTLHPSRQLELVP
jgi:hypothetical protein